jgi:beta-N-acetylhexosaminidase
MRCAAGPARGASPLRRRRPRRGPTALAAATGLALVALAGCTGDGSGPSAPATTSGPTARPTVMPSGAPTPSRASASPSPSPSPSAGPSASTDPLAGWTVEEKVGQVLMVGVDVAAPGDVTREALVEGHAGGLFLHGRSGASVEAVRALVDGYRAHARQGSRVPLLVATDQEGGQVQVLQGPGFARMPSATAQAELDPAALREDAAGWGAQLRAAGVDVNLAPVADLVTAASAAGNPPVGASDRSYGFTPGSVAAGAGAFAGGMLDAGVVPTIKHFPGLGEVTANTDTDEGVTDGVTTADAESVEVFETVIDASPGAWVMTSTAVYARIDPDAPAAFSRAVVGGVLRDRLGFDGVVITDDLSAAQQVQAWSPGERAVRAIAAGNDVVLASARPGVADEMADTLVRRAEDDPAFAAQVDEAARRVLAAKAARPR